MLQKLEASKGLSSMFCQVQTTRPDEQIEPDIRSPDADDDGWESQISVRDARSIG